MFQVGDHVECRHDGAWQSRRRASDERKAKKLGMSFFMGRAAAYMHLDEAYVVTSLTETGGVRLRGFVPVVSTKDLCPSTKPVYR